MENLNSNTKLTTIRSTERFQPPFKKVNSFEKTKEENIRNRIRCDSEENWFCALRQTEDWSFVRKVEPTEC
jgi:hypothetical protein